VNSPDDQDIALQFDLAQRFGDETAARCIDLTRFQRASKGSRKSTGGRGDNVIQRRSVGLQNGGRHFIVQSDSAVDPEGHGLGFGRQIGPTDRTLYPFNADFGTIDDFRHLNSPHARIAGRTFAG